MNSKGSTLGNVWTGSWQNLLTVSVHSIQVENKQNNNKNPQHSLKSIPQSQWACLYHYFMDLRTTDCSVQRRAGKWDAESIVVTDQKTKTKKQWKIY